MDDLVLDAVDGLRQPALGAEHERLDVHEQLRLTRRRGVRMIWGLEMESEDRAGCGIWGAGCVV